MDDPYSPKPVPPPPPVDPVDTDQVARKLASNLAEKGDFSMVESIWKNLPPLPKSLFDMSLPRQSVDPSKEWIFPGHAEPLEPVEDPAMKIRRRCHMSPEQRAKDIADEAAGLHPSPKTIPRVLMRHCGIVHWPDPSKAPEGEPRPHYALIHGHGHQTDVYHTFPKSHWSEQEATDFHQWMKNHPHWTAPNPVQPKRVHLPDLYAKAKAMAAMGQTKGAL